MRPWDLSNVRLGSGPLALGAELRSRALTAVERAPGASDRVRQAGTRIVEQLDDPYGRLARGILLLSDPRYMAAWGKIARDPATGHHEWSAGENGAVLAVERWAGSRENRAMSLTDAGGGYLVPFQLDPTVTITANGSINQVRRVARQVIATTDRWNGVNSSAAAWSYDAEATEVSDDSPTFTQPTVPICKAQGFVPVSVELFEDAPNATQAVSDALAFGKDVLEASAFSVGTGVGMPTGIVTALTGTGSVIPAATAGTVTAADVYGLHDSLPSRYGSAAGAAWLANRLVYTDVRQLDVPGAGLWGAPPEPGEPPTLLDRPALVSDEMDGTLDATAGNDAVLILGDWDHFVIADRIASTVIDFIPRLPGPGGRPSGQRGWLAHIRHGAAVLNTAAFRMLTA
jgi:HK97 family phage major capsid protein